MRAEAFSNRRGLVLDTFRFADPNRTLDLNPSEIDRLRIAAERVITGRKDVRDLLKNRPKPQLPSRKARIPATVSFDPDASDAATLIEFVADRPGHDFRYEIDPSRAEAALAWTAPHDFETGLARTIDWYLANRGWWQAVQLAARIGATSTSWQ